MSEIIEINPMLELVQGQEAVNIRVGVALGVELKELPYMSDFGIDDLLFYKQGSVIESEIRERLALVGVEVTSFETTTRGYTINGVAFENS